MSEERGSADDAFRRAVEAARRGEESGFRWLYERCRPRALALLRRRFSRLSSAETEELFQDAFVEATRKLDDLGSAESFAPWLYAGLVRRCVRHLRRRDTEREVLEDLPWGPAQPGAVSDAELRERRIAGVRDAIGSVTEWRQREVATLRYIQGETRREIAEKLGIKAATVDTILYRFRKRVRVRLVARLCEIDEEARNDR